VLKPLTDFTLSTDSKSLCSDVIGQVSVANSEISMILSLSDIKKRDKKVRGYEWIASTTIEAIIAARDGDLDSMRELVSLPGWDISQGDYDMRTPLHAAAKSGNSIIA
jgi:ankyrin repeat protein